MDWFYRIIYDNSFRALELIDCPDFMDFNRAAESFLNCSLSTRFLTLR